MNNNIFIYKLTADNGGAPAVHNNLLSLCICKPRIRQSAKEGDWIIGMGGKSIPDLNNRVIYIAQVTNVIMGSDYYSNKYKDRPDCIYELNNQEFNWRKGSNYHSQGDLAHDLGEHPNYDRAICLMSKNFVYFGRNKEPSIKGIQDIYDELPRDYRVNHDYNTSKRLDEFIKETISKFGNGKHGEPTHLDLSKKCNTIEGDILQCTRKC